MDKPPFYSFELLLKKAGIVVIKEPLIPTPVNNQPFPNLWESIIESLVSQE